MNRISLCGTWECRCLGEGKCLSFPATVPGSSLSDLIAAGALPEELFSGRNADRAVEFEHCDFIYSRTFDWTPTEGRVDLTFERLDTYCDCYLNGTLLGHRENGNIAHRFRVDALLQAGENRLEVRFASPIRAVEGRPHRDGAFTTERLYTRRRQCSYGWDWVARFVSVGMTGAVTLTAYAPDEPCAELYVYTKHIAADNAQIGVEVSFEEDYAGRLFTLSVLDPDGKEVRRICRYCRESEALFSIDVPNARLWYPLGYGEHPLYTLILSDAAGELARTVFGIRTVRILQLPDAPDSPEAAVCREIANPDYDFNEESVSFSLLINGMPIFCMGANWVPCEPFENGHTAEKTIASLRRAAEMGVNMLRVWGGGSFERPSFYEECSRLGILVTQDFLMACGSYPEEEEWFLRELSREAEYAARLARNYPSLVWWSGDNENAVGGSDTQPNYCGRASAYKGLAPVLRRLDPYREFLPSSPYGGDRYASNTVGTTHNTQFLSMLFESIDKRETVPDYRAFFKRFRARFIAEEPQCGAVNLSSLRRFLSKEEIFYDHEMWKYHTKNNPFLARELLEYTADLAEQILGEFTSPADRVFKYRYVQYEWLRTVMEQARRERRLCSGIVFWMLNDCWPAASGWALIDYYLAPKDAFYAFRRCAAPAVASFDRTEQGLSLFVSAEGRAVDGVLTVRRVAPDLRSAETVLTKRFSVPSGASHEVALLPEASALYVADVEGDFGHDRTFWYKGPLQLVPAEVRAVREEDGGLTVTADGYVHCVELDAGDAILSDNCFSLLPGEAKRVTGASGDVTVTAYTVG